MKTTMMIVVVDDTGVAVAVVVVVEICDHNHLTVFVALARCSCWSRSVEFDFVPDCRTRSKTRRRILQKSMLWWTRWFGSVLKFHFVHHTEWTHVLAVVEEEALLLLLLLRRMQIAFVAVLGELLLLPRLQQSDCKHNLEQDCLGAEQEVDILDKHYCPN